MNIFNKIEQITDLTDNEKILVTYMKDKTNEFMDKNASQISQSCFVSTATIYRFCQKLGLSGLSELKVQISASLENYLKEKEAVDYNYPFKQNETQYQIIHSLREVYDQTLTSTQNLLDLEQLRLIASCLKKAKHIDIYTTAGNIFFAENFRFQMKEIGIDVNVPVDSYQQSLSASISDKDHVAMIISFGGRGALIEDISKLLKENDTPIILICSTLENPLKLNTQYILYMSSHEDHFNKISSFSTRLSLLYILDSIYTCYFKLDYDKNIQNKLKYYKHMANVK